MFSTPVNGLIVVVVAVAGLLWIIVLAALVARSRKKGAVRAPDLEDVEMEFINNKNVELLNASVITGNAYPIKKSEFGPRELAEGFGCGALGMSLFLDRDFTIPDNMLGKAFSKIRFIEIRAPPSVTVTEDFKKLVPRLAKCKMLKSIKFKECAAMGELDFNFEKLGSLESIEFFGCPLDRAKFLRVGKNVVIFTLAKSSMGEQEFEKITPALKGLRFLALFDNKKMGLLPDIKAMHSLFFLWIKKSGFLTVECVKRIPKNLAVIHGEESEVNTDWCKRFLGMYTRMTHKSLTVSYTK
jgi:hypothetical protein